MLTGKGLDGIFDVDKVFESTKPALRYRAVFCGEFFHVFGGN